jgi:hypothetical protein
MMKSTILSQTPCSIATLSLQKHKRRNIGPCRALAAYSIVHPFDRRRRRGKAALTSWQVSTGNFYKRNWSISIVRPPASSCTLNPVVAVFLQPTPPSRPHQKPPKKSFETFDQSEAPQQRSPLPFGTPSNVYYSLPGLIRFLVL